MGRVKDISTIRSRECAIFILYNYPPQGQWIVVDIYREAKYFFPFAKQWIAKDIPSYGSQSKRAKIAIHWFGKY